jgi:excisionase family DNA binding protein
MKTARFQFGMRENTASSRQHASCLASDTRPNPIFNEGDSPQRPRLSAQAPATRFENPYYAAAQAEATGEKRRHESRLLTVHEVAELLQVPLSWVYGRMRKRSSGRLPGFRLGKYWRFSESEVLAWVDTQREGPHDA